MTLLTIDETAKLLAFSGDEDENADDIKEDGDGLGLEGLDEEEKDPGKELEGLEEDDELKEDDEDEPEGE